MSHPSVDGMTCLYVSLIDNFGDGWTSTSQFKYWGVIEGLSSDVKQYSLACNCSKMVGCIPVSPAESRQQFHFAFENSLGANPEFFWEIFWTVQIVENGVWGNKYYGGYNTTMIFDYNPSTGHYADSAMINTLGYPDSCVGGGTYNGTDVTDRYVNGMYGLSSDRKFSLANEPTGHQATSWYITDVVGKAILYSYSATACESYGAKSSYTTCLDSGNYIFRSTGACDPLAYNYTWEFCGMTGGAQEELQFTVVDGKCIRGAVGPVEGVCGKGLTYSPTGSPTELPAVVLTNVLQYPLGPSSGTGLYVTIYDQFGDGWKPGVNISYFVTVRGLDSNTISTGLLDGEWTKGGLISVSTLPYNHRFHLSLAAIDKAGAIMPEPEFYWEIHWSVQFISNGALGRIYYGGYDTDMVIDYSISTRNFRFIDWKNLWIYPEGCGDFCNYKRVTSTSPYSYFVDFVDSGSIDLADTPPSSSASDVDFLEAGWYVTDTENKTVLFAYGKPYCDAGYDAGGGVATTCKTCLADGEYIFRVTGANDPDASIITWDFCGSSGGAKEELRFTLSGGVCAASGLALRPPAEDPDAVPRKKSHTTESQSQHSLSIVMILLISGFSAIALVAIWFCLVGTKKGKVVSPVIGVVVGGPGSVVPEDVF
jgi:hypothetical protein